MEGLMGLIAVLLSLALSIFVLVALGKLFTISRFLVNIDRNLCLICNRDVLQPLAARYCRECGGGVIATAPGRFCDCPKTN